MKLRLFLFSLFGALIALADTSIARAPQTFSWHSSGDSYSSGEGVRGNLGWCAHSEDSYGPSAARQISHLGYTVTPNVFTACTGHLVEDFLNRNPSEKGTLVEWAAEQGLTGSTADVLTFSFGGNDIGFSDLVQDCLGKDEVLNKWNFGQPTSVVSLVKGYFSRNCDIGADSLFNRVQQLEFAAKKDCNGSRGGHLNSEAIFSCDLLIDGKGSSTADDDFRGVMSDFYRYVSDRYVNPGA
jgi:hypothetical protein